MVNTATTLTLIQIADSAFPIGGFAHSFGLETAVTEQSLTPSNLSNYIADLMQTVGRQEAWACRMGWVAATRIASEPKAWITLNQTVAALKSAHELRTASEKLGRRLLQIVGQMARDERLDSAWQSNVPAHHAPTFGLVSAVLNVDVETTIAVYLQQMVMTMVSAAQRLLSIGQRQTTQIVWDLRPTIQTIADMTTDELPHAFPGLPEMAGLRHPHLATRLFIS